MDNDSSNSIEYFGDALVPKIESEISLIVKEEPLHECFIYNNETLNKYDDIKLKNCNDIEFKKRQIIENETTVYRCHECINTFQKFSDFKLHKAEHSIKKRTCTICNLLCRGVTRLKEHMNIHNGIKPFKCTKCSKGFTSANHLKCHMDSHRDENNFKCEKCEKTFKTKRTLAGHIDTHAKRIKDFICKICNEDFNLLNEYCRHLTQKHGEEVPKPKCIICDKIFKTETLLQAHLKEHKDLTFPCEYCNKIFTTMYKIKRHVKRSHVINECEYCDKVFYDKAEFGKHKKEEHTTEGFLLFIFIDLRKYLKWKLKGTLYQKK